MSKVAYRLAWATDVHLNFLDARGRAAFASEVEQTGADALLLTGDIAEAPSLVATLQELERKLRRPIYFVLGNHDYYRGDLAGVRAQVRALSEASAYLRWLPAVGAVELAAGVALVGHDGWADGRLGDYESSNVLLNDSVLIQDFAGLPKPARLAVMQQLADDGARYLSEVVPPALAQVERLIVATHVPPFRESCWHEGKISGPDWLPHFACKAVGDVLLQAAEARPDRQIEVLCGHTHGGGTAQVRPNLVVRTGGAEYGEPRVQAVLALGAPAG
jgi:predicted phosphohydrolase